MKIDILHVRDPDSACVTRLWVDGVEVEAEEEDVDCGAGWEYADWVDRIAGAVELPAGGYRDAVLQALLDPPGASDHIEGWGQPWDKGDFYLEVRVDKVEPVVGTDQVRLTLANDRIVLAPREKDGTEALGELS